MAAPILKTPEEIEKMRAANQVVAKVHKLMGEMAVPGVTTLELDQAAEKLIRSEGATPSFLNYPNPAPGGKSYPASICASINEEVVHGIPSADRVLEEGQIISIDIGTVLDGWNGDATRTFAIGEISRKAKKLIKISEESLEAAIRIMKPGVALRKISASIQSKAENAGFSVVKQFVGHGIGRNMHEPPQVPNYVSKAAVGRGLILEAGTVLAIEPMINIGKSEVKVLSDGWTVVTKDGTLSVHVEDSIAITENGPVILSRL